jgi:hypothetical protein
MSTVPLADYLRNIADGVESPAARREMRVDLDRARTAEANIERVYGWPAQPWPTRWRAADAAPPVPEGDAPKGGDGADSAKLAKELVAALEALGDMPAIAKAILAAVGVDGAGKLIAAAGGGAPPKDGAKPKSKLEQVEQTMRRNELASREPPPANEEQRAMRATMDARMGFAASGPAVERRGNALVFRTMTPEQARAHRGTR